jgi:hypothetical protein
MSYPQQQPQFPPAAPQPQGYPPQPPPALYSPPQPQAPYAAPQGYPPPQAPQYGQPPQYAQPQMPPPIPGTLDDFYSQPSTGGGKALAFEAPGTSYVGIVTRPITDADIEQQTNPQNGAPAFFKDGRPKFVLRIPLQIQPCPAYPDGLAQWYCRGSGRDDLVRAMAEAGAPEGPPEAGAVITITMTGTRPSGPGLNPTKLFAVQYQRPQGAKPIAKSYPGDGMPDPTPPASPPAAPPAYQPAPPPVYAINGNGSTASATGNHVPPTSQPSTPIPPAPIPPAPAPVPPPPAPTPADFSPEQQALLAQLTAQQPQPTH